MTADEFRRFAVSLPEASENAHMGHPDFRVRNKIFATLSPEEDSGMVKLTPDLQASLIATDASIYYPAAGAWGRRGCTMVRLANADPSTVRGALMDAWRNTAPKRLVAQHDA
jgi:hypothetical protein